MHVKNKLSVNMKCRLQENLLYVVSKFLLSAFVSTRWHHSKCYPKRDRIRAFKYSYVINISICSLSIVWFFVHAEPMFMLCHDTQSITSSPRFRWVLAYYIFCHCGKKCRRVRYFSTLLTLTLNLILSDRIFDCEEVLNASISSCSECAYLWKPRLF